MAYRELGLGPWSMGAMTRVLEADSMLEVLSREMTVKPIAATIGKSTKTRRTLLSERKRSRIVMRHGLTLMLKSRKIQLLMKQASHGRAAFWRTTLRIHKFACGNTQSGASLPEFRLFMQCRKRCRRPSALYVYASTYSFLFCIAA